MTKTLIILMILSFSWVADSRETLFDLPEIEENAEAKADKLFDDGKYQESFQTYLPLAKLGDKYSQYMVSVQYLNGLGIEKDSLQAYGWANLARRSKTKEIKDYYEQLKSTISPEDEEEAEKIKLELSEKYNDLAIAMKLKRMIRNTIPKCTGSRIRGNCSFIKHFCVDSGSQKSYENCLREVNLRDPKVIRGLKQDLAKTDAYIEQKLLKGGTVTVEEVDNSKSEETETESSETEEK